jgi:hypothetical protein
LNLNGGLKECAMIPDFEKDGTIVGHPARGGGEGYFKHV